MAFKKKTFDESFWALVDKSGECWTWRGARRGGRHNQYGNWRGNMAHRISWERANGVIPVGKVVCHKCDNPLCVNPDHLFVGTMRDNAEDMMRKMRHSSARLDWEKVAQIRSLRGRIYQRLIAEKFNVSQSTVSEVLLGKRWRSEDTVV